VTYSTWGTPTVTTHNGSGNLGFRYLYEPPWVQWRLWSALPFVESDNWTVMLPTHQEAAMGRRAYPAEFRRRVLDLLAAGRKVVDLSRDLAVSERTIYTWRQQERIDRGLVPGLTSVEREELAAARRRIRELEVHRRATELLTERRDPKAGSRRSR